MYLKYQKKFLENDAKIKVWRKSRRIGATFCVARNACLVSSRQTKPYDVWVSSADMGASKEFLRVAIDYAGSILKDLANKRNIKIFNDEKTDLGTMCIKFSTKKRITALSSEPRALRGNGGSVILDEFAFHENQKEMWKAATPVTRWGGNLQVLSSVANEGNFFEQLCTEAKSSKNQYFQQTTIIDALTMACLIK